MEIRSVEHRGLERLITNDESRELRRDLVARKSRILTALVLAPDAKSILGPPGWRIHQLTGDRAETWSINVSGNWRITFKVEDGAIAHLNLEDYH